MKRNKVTIAGVVLSVMLALSACHYNAEQVSSTEQEHAVPGATLSQSTSDTAPVRPKLPPKSFPLNFEQDIRLDYEAINSPVITLSDVEEPISDLDGLAAAVDLNIMLQDLNGAKHGLRYYQLSSTLLSEIKDNPLRFISQSLQTAALAHNFLSDYDLERIAEGLIGVEAALKEDYATQAQDKELTLPAVALEFYLNSLQSVPRQLKFSDLPLVKQKLSGLKVASSEALFWAVSNGYIPIAEAGSSAERLLKKAVTILGSITDKSMDELRIYQSIYQYVVQTNLYDYSTQLDGQSHNYRNRALFLEGSLEDGLAVCDGLTKEIVLLSRLMGLEAYHIGARYENFGHAYLYVKVNGQFYLSCPTSGIGRYPNLKEQWQAYHSQDYMLVDFDTNSDDWHYDSDAMPEIEAEVKQADSYDYWSKTELTLEGQTYTLHPESVEEALPVLRAALELRGRLGIAVEVELCGQADVLRSAYHEIKNEVQDVVYLSGGTFKGKRIQTYLFPGSRS